MVAEKEGRKEVTEEEAVMEVSEIGEGDGGVADVVRDRVNRN